jgi:hypothetical protein
VEFYEVSGDYTSIAFKNIQVNQPVDFWFYSGCALMMNRLIDESFFLLRLGD